MRKIIIIAAVAALGAGAALAQDAPPPGCRWMGDGNLACKDGKGHWRRSGDDQIVGTYPLSKPKPKPKPAPVAAVAPATTAPAPVAPPLPPPAPVTEPAPPPAAAPAPAQAEAPAPLPAAEPAPPTVEPAKVEPPKSWWRRWLDSIWHDIQALLRLFGIGK